MPIWLELLVLLLTTYVIGIGVGWAIWGRTPHEADHERGRKGEE